MISFYRQIIIRLNVQKAATSGEKKGGSLDDKGDLSTDWRY